MSKYSLLNHRKLKDVIPVPEGLSELMADIAREVIRFQPANVERFIADYLESMLITREMIYNSQRTMQEVFDSSIQIAEIMKQEDIAFDKIEIGVNIIREELETSFNESKFTRKLRIINRLINECQINETRARKVINTVEATMAHYRTRNSCCSKNYSQPIHLEAVKKTFDFHLRLDNLAKTPGLENGEILGIFDENSYWTSENFAKREQAANKIRAWYLGVKQKRKFNKEKSDETQG